MGFPGVHPSGCRAGTLLWCCAGGMCPDCAQPVTGQELLLQAGHGAGYKGKL